MGKLKYEVPGYDEVPADTLKHVKEFLYEVIGGLVEYELNNYASNHKVNIELPDTLLVGSENDVQEIIEYIAKGHSVDPRTVKVGARYLVDIVGIEDRSTVVMISLNEGKH